MTDTAAELSADDSKLVTLARAARARAGSPAGAAVRDETGRTYAGADVTLPSLALDCVALAVAQAVAAGAARIDALAIVGPQGAGDTAPASDMGCRIIIRADRTGAMLGVHRDG